jgi:hypothetical protein
MVVDFGSVNIGVGSIGAIFFLNMHSAGPEHFTLLFRNKMFECGWIERMHHSVRESWIELQFVFRVNFL